MGQYIVRYGAMRHLGVFSGSENRLFPLGTRIIVRTGRGLEAGVVLCEATREAISKLESGYETDRIIREMTREDFSESRRIRSEEKNEFARCRQIIKRMSLDMNLVRVEHIFGGERIIVYYVAEGRIDFRELVKVLASEFQTRIEMRQIGVRDETKLLADFGDCGREVCCNSYLIEMPPVSMKMAKLQKATLDPTKISGRCGRLKCCLRYEYDAYLDLQNRLPEIGKKVDTPDGPGKVLSHEILRQKVWVELSDMTRKIVSPDELQMVSNENAAEEGESNEFEESV